MEPRTRDEAKPRKRTQPVTMVLGDPFAEQPSPTVLTNLLTALQAMRLGDFSVRMAGDQVGILGKIADAFNDIAAANERMAEQLEHVRQALGREGKTRYRVTFGGV